MPADVKGVVVELEHASTKPLDDSSLAAAAAGAESAAIGTFFTGVVAVVFVGDFTEVVAFGAVAGGLVTGVTTRVSRDCLGVGAGTDAGKRGTGGLDAAADAVLALAHVKGGGGGWLFDEVGQKLLAKNGNSEELRAAVAELGRVAAEAGAAFGGDRLAGVQAAKVFREAVVKFSSSARNCLVSVATEEARQVA